MIDQTPRWKSPYQSYSYNNALNNAGFSVCEHFAKSGETIYFNGEHEKIAWEVPAGIDVSNINLSDHSLYQLAAEQSTGLDPTSYYTRIITPSDPRFSKRFLRSVRRARSNYPNYDLTFAETDQQISAALKQFEEYPERRDNIEMVRFNRLIKSLAKSGLVLVAALRTTHSSDIVGTSCVLHNDIQANTRYYSAERDNCIGHLMNYLLIEQLIDQMSFDLVDLSGISPCSSDKKMKQIDEFKQQIGGQIIEFTKLKKESTDA